MDPSVFWVEMLDTQCGAWITETITYFFSGQIQFNNVFIKALSFLTINSQRHVFQLQCDNSVYVTFEKLT